MNVIYVACFLCADINESGPNFVTGHLHGWQLIGGAQWVTARCPHSWMEGNR